MRTMHRVITPLLAATALSPAALAQFRGDMFFEDTTTVIEQGSTASVTVLFFTGTTTHGAAAFNLNFDSSQLEFVGAEFPPESDYDSATFFAAGNQLTIAVFNSDSTDIPIGTEILARVEFLAIGDSGTSTPLTIAPFDAVDSTTNTITPLQGLGASVLIIDPSSGPVPMLQAGGTTGEAPEVQDPVTGRLTPYRRLGASVEAPRVPIGDEPPTPALELIQTRALGAPSDCVTNGPDEGPKDVAAIIDFFDAFASRSARADMNYDGMFDMQDVVSFVDVLDRGCP